MIACFYNNEGYVWAQQKSQHILQEGDAIDHAVLAIDLASMYNCHLNQRLSQLNLIGGKTCNKKKTNFAQANGKSRTMLC